MNLRIDTDAFEKASVELQNDCDRLKTLRTNLKDAFVQLEKDWDSDAGKTFFGKFDKDLLDNLSLYSTVFEHISKNLTTASEMYGEVFRAADTIAQTEY